MYELIYFLDEGFSHYVQFGALFFVMGWFLIFDRAGRTGNQSFALFLGSVHGIERGVGIVEGEKWFLGPAAILWMAFAAWLRWRRVGPAVTREFFFRHAAVFSLTLPASEILYVVWFHSFAPPSSLNDGELAQMAVGAAGLAVAGTVAVAAIDWWWHRRRARFAPAATAVLPAASTEGSAAEP